MNADVLALAANDVRRTALSVLSRRGAMTIPALATVVTAACCRVAPETVTGAERRRHELLLRHAHLPKLADAGVVSIDPDRSFVRPLASPLFEEPVATLVDPDSGVSTDVIGAIANERRLLVLAILDEAAGPCTTTNIATQVVAAERNCEPATVPDRAREDCRTELSHVHLPALVDAALVERLEAGYFVHEETLPAPVRAILEIELTQKDE